MLLCRRDMLKDSGLMIFICFILFCSLVNTISEDRKEEEERKIKDPTERILPCDKR